jgi:hypothetical protein
MLILPPGHAEQVSTHRGLSRREKRLVAGVLAVVVVLALVLVVSIGSGGRSSGNGCIYATIPGPVGAQQVSQCGSQARDTCLTARSPGSFTPQAERVIADQCRKAGLPVGG